VSELRRAQTDLWAAAEATAAHRRGETVPEGEDEAGEPTVAARVGALLEAQAARATVEIAAVLKGMIRG
jgi:hypothetical protein